MGWVSTNGQTGGSQGSSGNASFSAARVCAGAGAECAVVLADEDALKGLFIGGVGRGSCPRRRRGCSGLGS